MTKQERVDMYNSINRHGEKLLKLFPNAKQQDPVKLCKSLRRYEGKAERVTVALCNGDMALEEGDCQLQKLHYKVRLLLGGNGAETRWIFINQDPRGYALKIDSDDSKIQEFDLYRDLGGYGILAPDFTPNT